MRTKTLNNEGVEMTHYKLLFDYQNLRLEVVLFASTLLDIRRPHLVEDLPQRIGKPRKENIARDRTIHRVDAPRGHVPNLEPRLVGVVLAHGARVHGRRAEAALNGGRQDKSEDDLRVLNGQRLEQQERGRLGRCIQRPRGRRDHGGYRGDQHNGRRGRCACEHWNL
jgi:hypothetical protein